MKKVVVFGATGNLGAYIAIDLKKHGYQVVATGHRTSDNGFFASQGIEYVSVISMIKRHLVNFPRRMFMPLLILQENFLRDMIINQISC